MSNNKQPAPNWLDKTIGFFSPETGIKRLNARHRLTNFYDAAKPTLDRKPRTDRGSGDAMVGMAGDRLRVMARDLDNNHDLASGVLDILVNKTVGSGIRYEPQVMGLNGELHDEFNEILLDRHERWSEAPDVTREMSRSEMERLFARTWFRDGEAFKVYHMGHITKLPHPTDTLLSLDVFEPDLCPFGYNRDGENIIQGIQKNGWGRPTYYYFHKDHPGQPRTGFLNGDQLKKVSANYVNHIKSTKRLRQTRGVSVFHNIMLRLDDLKDYEEAERIAARITAKMVMYTRKGLPDMYGDDNFKDAERSRTHYENGMTMLDLLPGEDVGAIDTNRPNTNLGGFRKVQMAAIAAGVGASASSVSKSYDGTYSAQRQEMVEQQENYDVLQDLFINHSCRPDYKKFVDMTLLGGDKDLNKLLYEIDKRTLYDLECYGATMPWVDPDKETKGIERNLDNQLMSQSEAIRKRGKNPKRVFEQIARDERLKKRYGIPARIVKNQPQNGGDDGVGGDNEEKD